MSDDLINIEVDGIPLQGRKGEMLIEVTDAAGINIPRFCYHRKLSIAANCRMCLVEVERAPKPLPACSTPVSEGMRVFTRSPKALAAQRATMEFLLINHPLDCPICDQGGECELQDVAMGYGEGIGQYSETKRVVKDKDIGPLIATDMTRCIHCTRCVRFGEEIAGLKELGATGRSEHMEIGTYVARTISSELSGNVIDLCPVGALTAKPSRYTLRPWEITQHAAISPLDSVGANLYLHTRNGKVMRAVPRENEPVNETWIADRDRFAYEGIYAADRLMNPMRRDGDTWREVSWEEALETAAQRIKGIMVRDGANEMGALISPHASLEEHYLAQKLLRGLGSQNIDHRLRQRDFSGDADAPVMPWLGHDIAAMDTLSAALVVGADIRAEAPLLALRLRKAALRGARIAFINPLRLDLTFEPFVQHVGDTDAQIDTLLALLKLAGAVPAAWTARAADVAVEEGHRALLDVLRGAGERAIYLGQLAQRDARFDALRRLAGALAAATGAQLGYFGVEGNACGAWLAGSVPHRGPAGRAVSGAGRNALQMLSTPLKGYLLFGIEPEFDGANGAQALATLAQAETVVAVTGHATETLLRYAHVLLPLGSFAETSGTYVNAEGRWQSMSGAAAPVGQARPGWKILRVLGNLLDVPGFEQVDSEEVRDELRRTCEELTLNNAPAGEFAGETGRVSGAGGFTRVACLPLYAGNALVRRASSLQKTPAAQCDVLGMTTADARAQALVEGQTVRVRGGDAEILLKLVFDDRLPAGSVSLPLAREATRALGSVDRVDVRGA
ncbi:MAG: NADH-quinone oxidoreductase subunit NuoG [Halothiobacillaceae bacterium]|nr:NADH-quinone oxidoreductase subunit NuoG [Halothiobacillaceae bacterium]